MRDFYNDMVRAMDKYEVMNTTHKLCMLMAHKNQDAAYLQLILEELKLSSHNFDMCNDVSEIQRLAQSGNKGHWNEKGVRLSSIEGDSTFCRMNRNCSKACGYHATECKNHKGICMVEDQVKVKRAIPAMVAQQYV